MQSYRGMMMHDAQTIKEQSILKKGDFPGHYTEQLRTKQIYPLFASLGHALFCFIKHVVK
jgi:hypothetical protein